MSAKNNQGLFSQGKKIYVSLLLSDSDMHWGNNTHYFCVYKISFPLISCFDGGSSRVCPCIVQHIHTTILFKHIIGDSVSPSDL